MEHCDVAIVGCGPTGALLANLLGAAGLRVILLERDPEIHALPRAVHFDGEVMRIFQSAGLADRVATIARASTKGMHFVSASGQTLLVRRGMDGPGPQGWYNNWYAHQPDLDAVLRSGLTRYPNVEVALGHEVTTIRAMEDGVRLDVRASRTAPAREIAARYVVGCDGARSLVRQQMGVVLEDLGLHQPWLVVDLLVDPEIGRARGLADHTIQLCDPARPMTLVHVGGRRRRWEIMLMPGDDAASMAAPERIWPLLSRWLRPGEADIERAAVYTFHAVMARGWRRRRLMLAGDSCHQTPPFLGQGMCAGLRDAANLAWKLRWVIQRGAADTLLDTYESERRSHVAEFIELAVSLGKVIQETDPEAAAARDRSFAAGQPRLFDFPLPQLGPGVLDTCGRRCAPRPVGAVFPQPLLADGRRLDEATRSPAGPRFALVLGRSTPIRPNEAEMRHLAAHDVAIVVDDGAQIARWLDEHGCSGVLIRPDGYLLGLIERDADIARLIRLLPA